MKLYRRGIIYLAEELLSSFVVSACHSRSIKARSNSCTLDLCCNRKDEVRYGEVCHICGTCMSDIRFNMVSGLNIKPEDMLKGNFRWREDMYF